MIRKSLLVVCLWGLCSSLAFAQNQQPTGKITVQKPTVASNLQETTRVLNQPRLRVIELNPADRLRAVNEALKKRGLPTTTGLTPGATIKLAMPNATSGGETYLSFFKPHIIDFSHNVAQFNASQSWIEGSLLLNFKPTAPGKYLLDFTVENNITLGNLTIEFTLLSTNNSLKQTFQMPGSHEHKISHITFLVDIADTQKTGFVLSSDYGWKFYQCEITPFK
jgi:hypothetical protein